MGTTPIGAFLTITPRRCLYEKTHVYRRIGDLVDRRDAFCIIRKEGALETPYIQLDNGNFAFAWLSR